MSGENEKDVLPGTQIRKIDITRIGKRIAESGIIRVSSFREVVGDDGVLERINEVEFGRPDCEHIGVEIGGPCLCGLWWCRECIKKEGYGTCCVCGKIFCPSCGEIALKDAERQYHRECWPDFMRARRFK